MVEVTFPFDTEKIIPNQCYQWLKQYELTSQEIDNLDIGWSESQGLLIFPIKEENNFIGYIGRRFKGEGSKYIVKGEKNSFDITYGSGSTLVFTEDLISAVKVGRLTAAKPLFGTFLKSIPQEYDSYRLWLDKDKQISSIQQCKKWRQFGYNILPIITELDPKEYNTQQIQTYLNL